MKKPILTSLSRLLLPLLAGASLAVPTAKTVTFTPPLATAQTIQVTEILWEAQNGPLPGPLRQAEKTTFRIERPAKFWVEWKDIRSPKPASYTISDGKIMVSLDGEKSQSQPTAQAEWPFPMMGLLNNAPGPISAVPAVRNGQKVLLAIRTSPTSRQEFWFDPKTHLLLRDMMFMTWQGKTSEVMRTEYVGWKLNKPIDPTVFRVPVLSEQSQVQP